VCPQPGHRQVIWKPPCTRTSRFFGVAVRAIFNRRDRMRMARNSLVLLLAATAAGAATLRIPAARGPVTIDGVGGEELWKDAAVLPVQPADFGAPFPAGGEIRAVVRGTYLCLSARLPETGPVVARSTGLNPVWWREDLVTWSLHFKSFSTYLNVR